MSDAERFHKSESAIPKAAARLDIYHSLNHETLLRERSIYFDRSFIFCTENPT